MAKYHTDKTGGLLALDTSDFKQFASGLNKTNRKMATEFRKSLRRGAEVVADQARVNASWSHEIPMQIKTGGSGASTWVDVTNSGRGSGSGSVAIEFEMGNRNASGRGRRGEFKHPVFNSKGQPSFQGKGDRAYYEQRTQDHGVSNRHGTKRYGSGVGWASQRLRPYLRPAFEMRHDEVTEIVRAALLDSLKNL